MSEKETETINGKVLKETQKALLFQPQGTTREVWIPRSLIPYMKIGTLTKLGEIKVEAWFAYKEKLV